MEAAGADIVDLSVEIDDEGAVDTEDVVNTPWPAWTSCR